MTETGAGSTVAVGDYLYRGDAEVARALLDSHGIAAYVNAEDEGGLNPGFFSEYRVVLVVKAHEAAAARALLGIGESLLVPNEVRQAMIAHSMWAAPDEACGLLAGTPGSVEMVFCLTNRLASSTRYSIDPREHFGALRHAEARGWSILGAWHSHPAGDAALSPTDRAQSPGGSWITLIVGAGNASAADLRAYRTDGAAVVEVAVEAEPPVAPGRLA